MDNIKNDDYYVNKIIENIKFAIDNTKDVDLDEFSNDKVLLNAILFSFIQISENASKLSSDFKLKMKDVEWHQIKGIRNRIVHDYDVVDEKTIYDTVVNDFPIFLKQLLENK